MKRSEWLHRTPPPERKNRLRSRQPRIRPVSAKRRAEQAMYLRLRADYLAANPRCAWPGCYAPADDLDHIANRSQARSALLDQSNWQGLCRPHHDHKTTHPAEALALGMAETGAAYRARKAS